MPLHIKDPAAEAAVRRLAKLRGITLTEAVRLACEQVANENKLQGMIRPDPEFDRFVASRQAFRSRLGIKPGETVEPLPKTFCDELRGEP